MENDRWATDLVHLLALAAKIESTGQYNIAKILRASTDAISRRAAYQQGAPIDTTALVKELERAETALANYGDHPEFVVALKQGKNAIAEGRLPFISEIPHPYVCRRCGHSFLGELPELCPTCGAWPSTFQQFLPIYWLNEFDPLTALVNLREAPEQFNRLIEGLDEDVLTRKPDGGGWSIRQVVTHLLDAQGVLSVRLKLLLEQDNPVLTSQAVFEWATREDGKPTTTSDIFETYKRSRKETLAILEDIPLKDWWRSGIHEEFGRLSLKQQVSYFAGHELTHLRQINKLRP